MNDLLARLPLSPLNLIVVRTHAILLVLLAAVLVFTGTGDSTDGESLIQHLTALLLGSIIGGLTILMGLLVLVNWLIQWIIGTKAGELEFLPPIVTQGEPTQIRFEKLRVLGIPGVSYDVLVDLGQPILIQSKSVGFNTKVFDLSGDLPRGDHQIQRMVVVFTDILGLFSLPIPIRTSGKVTILPKAVSIKDLEVVASYSDESSHKRTVDPKPSEEYDIRKYEPGDEMRRIHWKLFAKSQELFVRKEEFDDPLLTDLLLVLSCPAIRPHPNRSEFVESYVSQAAGLASLLNRKVSRLTAISPNAPILIEGESAIHRELAMLKHGQWPTPEQVMRKVDESRQEGKQIRSIALIYHPFGEDSLASWVSQFPRDLTVVVYAIGKDFHWTEGLTLTSYLHQFESLSFWLQRPRAGHRLWDVVVKHKSAPQIQGFPAGVIPLEVRQQYES